MVITDLHGDWHTYSHLRQRFLEHRTRGEADKLVICGDLLHQQLPDAPDASYEMLQDVMGLQADYGRDTIMLLLGNHEMPHIYDVMFNRENSALIYNPPLEHMIARHDREATARFNRSQIERFLRNLPLYVTTNAGVMLSHAGAPPYAASPDWLEIMSDFDHDALLQLADDKLRAYDLVKLRQDTHYGQQVKDMLAVDSVHDARFTNLLRSHIVRQEDLFALLWETLFVQHERSNPALYAQYVSDLLRNVSTITSVPQGVLVAGHVVVKDGMQWVTPQNLRIASGIHAIPLASARYLLFDASQTLMDVRDLTHCVRRVWDD